MRRASISIPANIAEGCGRQTDADFGHFLQIALGSAHELEYYCLLAHELKFLDDKDYSLLSSQVTEVKKMLINLIEVVRRGKNLKL